MGTKIINVRIAEDHWLLQEKNKSQVIRDALELYRKLHSELCQIKESVQEVKDMIGSGQLIVTDRSETKQQESTSADPRLINVLDDFLDI
jgi:4-aminobutyrate aminotransferase-like enzyme